MAKEDLLYPNIHPFYGDRLRKTSGFKGLILRYLPLHVLLVLKGELQILRHKCSMKSVEKKFATLSGGLVNIGSGNRGKNNWINVDVFPGTNVNCVYDSRKKLPFPDNSCRGIFTEHFLEHIDYTEEVPFFIAECFRVLESGGTFRIVVPDAGRYIQAYNTEGWESLRALRDMNDDLFDRYTNCAYNTKMELVNEIFRQAYTHKFAYDAETLVLLLERHGFENVAQTDYGKSREPDICIDFKDRAHESLYVEGSKP